MSLYQSFQSNELAQQVYEIQDIKLYSLADNLIQFFLLSPFGQPYFSTHVRPSEDIPLSKIYSTLEEHPDKIKLNSDSFAIRMDPMPIDDIANQFHIIYVHSVLAQGPRVDSKPVEAFLLEPAQARLTKLVTRAVFDQVIEKNMLINLSAAIQEWSQEIVKEENGIEW
ncbi:Conserved_hypothetical protein [Hexamita inflata]|uniref:Uncharacterized protein n=1 Tax=Hexamita inflata TaxID=28002 RepID=A0AA86P662_9EUKA|nr:Conserved hypothetical protein [Hexamita inflata]CAI9961970.1 Conserved hypothetical protein [Hexamita inflata]